ncbi:MAG TPA: excinuclease ABC subunit UvrC [Polyangiaceae bacterium]|nr:excinuclease ABC subunit UvrC [Polyangiaceae bacterium]
MGKPKNSKNDYAEQLEKKLASLTPVSGCYLFKDKAGEIVYVGKAKSLRSRVKSYFASAPSDERYFVPMLRDIVVDLETVVTASEKEAAVLENELIKRHRPRFNVKLRDDKDFLCLRLDKNREWPRLETVRRPKPDGARYFGPYHSATSARRSLHLVNKHFKLRTCTDSELRSRKRPCLQYQIKRCPAPCVYEVDREQYAQQARAVELFLDARHDELTAELVERMQRASNEMEYELAAMYRDQLRAVESILERQRVVQVRGVDQDVVGLYREGEMVELVLMQVRQGHVTDTQSFSLGRSELPDEEIVSSFVSQYYDTEGPSAVLPDELVLPVRPDAIEGIAEWLSELRGRRVHVLVPKAGPRKKLLAMACDNAQHAFHEKRRASDEIEARLEEIRVKLRLPAMPHVIECCDISHLGGGDVVGAIAALRNGQPDKKRYKSFHVRTAEAGDDYQAMYEVLARRFRRGRNDEGTDGEWELPDLFVVDGGRGQLGVALTAARDLGLHDLTIVALAKERENVLGEKLVDRVYLPGQKNGIPLRSTSASLYFLARARDEAHRFANDRRERVGKKRRLRSELDDIKGLGPSTRKALLRELGSMQAIKDATDEQILAVSGVNRRHLTALRKVIAAPQVASS